MPLRNTRTENEDQEETQVMRNVLLKISHINFILTIYII